jgi:hypothetical protein
MDNEYYFKQLRKVEEMGLRAEEKQCQFFQHLLLVAITVFAIVISLHTSNSNNLLLQSLFVLSTILLATGILSVTMVYRDHIIQSKEAQKAFLDEVKEACHSNREVDPVFGTEKKRIKILEIVTYISLLLSLIGFTLYAVLNSL